MGRRKNGKRERMREMGREERHLLGTLSQVMGHVSPTFSHVFLTNMTKRMTSVTSVMPNKRAERNGWEKKSGNKVFPYMKKPEARPSSDGK